MKKLVLISTLIASFAGVSAFGQGYVSFVTSKSAAWDNFSTGVSHLAATIDVAFLWAASGDVPTVASLLPSSPIAGTTPFSYAQAWSDILTDPNFTIGVNAATGSNAVVRTAANGFVNYGASFGVQGTAASTTYTLFFVGWDATYASAAAASAAGAAVGWGPTFQYTTVSSIGTAPSMLGIGQFGVGTVPEPTTLALAGLGGMALMMFRRRK